MSLEDLTPAQQQQLRLGELLLTKNPDIALDAKRLARKADPTLRLPEVDLQDQLEGERKARKELEDKIDRQRIEDRVAERERVAKARIESSGFTVEEIEKIVKDEDLRGERAIDTAIKLAQLQREAAAPGAIEVSGSYPGPRGDMRGDPDLRKKSPGDLKRWGFETAKEMMTDALRRHRGAARGNGG